MELGYAPMYILSCWGSSITSSKRTTWGCLSFFMIAISLRILCSVLPSWSTRRVCDVRGMLWWFLLSLLSRSLLFLRRTHLTACTANARATSVR